MKKATRGFVLTFKLFASNFERRKSEPPTKATRLLFF
jgi:hypothetical protein